MDALHPRCFDVQFRGKPTAWAFPHVVGREREKRRAALEVLARLSRKQGLEPIRLSGRGLSELSWRELAAEDDEKEAPAPAPTAKAATFPPPSFRTRAVLVEDDV